MLWPLLWECPVCSKMKGPFYIEALRRRLAPGQETCGESGLGGPDRGVWWPQALQELPPVGPSQAGAAASQQAQVTMLWPLLWGCPVCSKMKGGLFHRSLEMQAALDKKHLVKVVWAGLIAGSGGHRPWKVPPVGLSQAGAAASQQAQCCGLCCGGVLCVPR